MIKIILAEDKPPILWSIKQKIQNFSANLEIAGEAFDGQKALALIDEYKPDIVFTDIRMPLMDGLDLIAEAKKLSPSTYFVIISGYDEFEYARRAMKLGVSEYLVKPVTQESINNVLQKITGDIETDTFNKSKKQLRDTLNLGIEIKEPNFSFENRYFHAAIFYAGSHSSQTIDYRNPFNFYWSRCNCEELIAGYTSEKVFIWCFEGKSLNEMVVITGIPLNAEVDMEQVFEALYAKISRPDVPITIVTSKRADNVNKIGQEVQHARQLLRRNLIFGKSSLIYGSMPPVNEGSKKLLLDYSLEKKLVSFVQNRQKSLFLNEIRQLLDKCEKSNVTQYNLEKLLKTIAGVCSKACLDMSAFAGDLELEIEEVLCITSDYSSLFSGLDSVLGQLFQTDAAPTSKKAPLKGIIETVESYIKLNYAKQITINDIAGMVNVDPCHLSKTFKSSFRVSPMEYLTNLRIEKSKELILNSSELMLKDIAEIVGYTNQYYFSRIFKLVTGQSPSEYKASR